MSGFDLFHHSYWQPLSYFGITHPLLTIQLDLVFNTWLVLLLLLLFSLIGKYALQRPESLLYTFYMTITRTFMGLVEQSWNAACPEPYFLIITTFFIFILTSNWLMLLGIEEPTANYNTTLALALLSFFYIQKEAIKRHGLIRYLNDFFKTPISISRFSWLKLPLIIIQYALNTIAALALFPLELMSKCSSILSMSFRLFGNILAGSIIFSLWTSFTHGTWYWQLFGLASGINLVILVFFGIFEGFLQAFVFSMLSITYISISVSHEETNEEHQ